MKTMKKLAGVALALVMALCLAAPAFAAGNDGSITINNAVEGQTYTAYKIFDLESFDNESNAFSYKVAEPWTNFVTGEGAGAAYVTVDEQNYVTWNDDKKSEADVAEFAKLALEYAKANGEITGTAQTAEGATVVFENLPLGYYLIDSSLGALCSLDTTNKEVVMREKNEKPTDKKESEMDPNSKVGSEVKYTVTINAKKGAQAYVVHDTMGAGLTFNSDSLVVTAAPVVEESETAEPVTVAPENYTLTQNVPHHDNEEDPEEVTSTCTFELAFDQDYLNTLTGDTTIVITYTATINSNAVISKDPITNKETLSYGDNNRTEETPGNKTEDKFYDFDLVKTDSKNELLADAVFQLKEGNTVIELVQNTDGTYRPAVAEDKAEGSEVMVVSQITTNDISKITFTGFAPGAYTLEEVTAPGGYNKLKAPVEIQIAQKKDVNNENKPMVDDKGNPMMTLYVDGVDRGFTATITPATTEGEGENAVTTPASVEGGVHITNYTGAELPSTGGIGTTIFYIVGAVLAVGAGVLLVTKKKMGADEE